MASVLLIVILFVVAICIAIASQRFLQGKGAVDQPSCGSCGYATRGIAELKCPECGADLREVGIVMPGDRGPGLTGCLWPALLTLAVPLLAVAGYMLLGLVVPHHQQQSTDFTIIPASDQYAHVQFYLDATVVTPAGTTRSYQTFDMNKTSYSPPTVEIEFGGSKSTLQADRIYFEVMPAYTNATANTTNYAPRFMVDPTTGVATWTDAQGLIRLSKGAVTHMDILAYLGSTGADTGNADVITEAQQLQGLIDGLINGTSQFQLQNFDSGGYGSGGNGQLGPVWMLPVYAGAWFLIWIIGLVVITIRVRKTNAQGQTG